MSVWGDLLTRFHALADDHGLTFVVDGDDGGAVPAIYRYADRAGLSRWELAKAVLYPKNQQDRKHQVQVAARIGRHVPRR